mgnify:CR=1 FL=1
MDQPFILEQTYNASIEKLWQAITNLEAMKAWYFPQLKRFKLMIGLYRLAYMAASSDACCLFLKTFILNI